MTYAGRVRLAAAIWIVFAIVAWNVVFDRVIVVAGRAYVEAAGRTSRETGTYLLLDAWMRPAIARAFWSATVVGAAIAVCGLGALALSRANASSRDLP